MSTRYKRKDTLRELFSRLPQKQLSEGFRNNMMQRIQQEARRMKRKDERFGLFITVVTAIVILVLGFFALYCLNIPKIEVRIPDLSTLPFFLYIGVLVSFLLAVDYLLRKHFQKKHSKQDS